MAQLDLGDGSGTSVLNGIVSFLSAGGSPTRIITGSVLGLIVAPFVALADIINAVGAFFSEPLFETADSIGDLQGALFQAPAELVEGGFQITEQTLATFLGNSLAGILAAPVAVGMTMLSLYLVVRYLMETETGDTIPGLPFDIPTDFLGVEEEEDPED